MFEPFTIQQAYIINYSLVFLPQIVVKPGALRPAWRGVSAFAEDRSGGDPEGLDVSGIGTLLSPPDSMWKDWSFPPRLWPWSVKTNAWRFEWLPDMELPSGSNPSTSLFIHIYPLGMVSVGLATAVGFGAGIEIVPFINLLKRMTPPKSRLDDKPLWLRILAPEAFAGREVNLSQLTALLLEEIRKSWFDASGSAQVVYMARRPDEAHLRGQHGGVTELVRVIPQDFDKARHAAGFRGIVTMRPSWRDIESVRLVKYREALAWTGRCSAWHYASGLNTVLWNNSVPEGWRGRHKRRDYTWRVAAVSELARLEQVLYQYSYDWVKSAQDRLLGNNTLEAGELEWLRPDAWQRLWLALESVQHILPTGDLKRAYESQTAKLGTGALRARFRALLEGYKEALNKVKQETPFHQVKIATLEKRWAVLIEDYEAANKQLGNEINEVYRNRLKRQIKELEREINEVEQELNSLR